MRNPIFSQATAGYKQALLVTVSAMVVTIAVAGTAHAQTFSSGGTYTTLSSPYNPDVASYAVGTSNAASPLLNAPVKSANEAFATTSMVLEDANGNPVLATVTGAVGTSGAPVSTKYNTETAGVSNSGGGAEEGYYLVNKTTGAIISAADATAKSITGASSGADVDAQGWKWVDPTTNDPTKTYTWKAATYENAPGFATAVVTAPGTLGAQQTKSHLVNTSTGEFVAPVADTNYTSGTGAAMTGYQWVNPADADALLAASTNYNYKAVVSTVDGPVTMTHSPNSLGVTNSTTSAPGAVVYASADNTGKITSYSAIGPDGAYFYGATVTVTNGTAAGTTTITDGNVTIGNKLTMRNGATVDMGNNRVQNVANPVLATDATNKGYVDAGLAKAYEGTAIAVAMAQPIFHGNQSFALRAGWGGYEGKSAFGVTAAGIISRNVFGPGTTATLDGGIGFGADEGTVAGRAGVTFGW
jgi:hypothetical protein